MFAAVVPGLKSLLLEIPEVPVEGEGGGGGGRKEKSKEDSIGENWIGAAPAVSSLFSFPLSFLPLSTNPKSLLHPLFLCPLILKSFLGFGRHGEGRKTKEARITLMIFSIKHMRKLIQIDYNDNHTSDLQRFYGAKIG